MCHKGDGDSYSCDYLRLCKTLPYQNGARFSCCPGTGEGCHVRGTCGKLRAPTGSYYGELYDHFMMYHNVIIEIQCIVNVLDSS